MEQLALFALPRSYKDEEEDADSNEAAAIGHSDNQSRELVSQDALSWRSDLDNKPNKDHEIPDIKSGPDRFPLTRDTLYPWSRKHLSFHNSSTSCPLPRYAIATSQRCDRDGNMYLFSGLVGSSIDLVGSSIVKVDLWRLKGLDYELMHTENEGPSPRMDARALSVGNAFIVFGGRMKLNLRDELDGTVWILNTCKTECSMQSSGANLTSHEKLVSG